MSYQSNPPPDPPPPDPPPPDPIPPDDTSKPQSVPIEMYVGIGVGSSLIVASVITGNYALKNKKKIKSKFESVKNYFSIRQIPQSAKVINTAEVVMSVSSIVKLSNNLIGL